jgi:hypothetical protein
LLVGANAATAGKPPTASAIVTPYASGLNNPRGLKFGPDGYLYVAEGGTGLDDTNPAPTTPPGGDCTVGAGGPGQYFGSPTGSRISKVDSSGNVTAYVDNLPSSDVSGLVSGVADIAFIGNTMYAILAGSGCSHGVSTPNGVLRVNPDGTTTMIADLGAYRRAYPVANPTDPVSGDFEPDGTWYSMIAVRGDLYAVEPNHGEVVKVTTSGDISRVIDLSATYGHIVPTSIAYHGNFYVGNLDEFGIPDGSSNVYKVTPGGAVRIDAKGFSVVTGVVFDARGRMYVLEATDSQTLSSPGRILRVEPSGRHTVIATDLITPTAMTMGPDGNIYVSNFGFGQPVPGLGQILKVQLTD